MSRHLPVAIALEGYGWHPEAWRHTPDRDSVLCGPYWEALAGTAERGLLALGAWLVFIGVATAGLVGQVRRGPHRALAAAGLASIAAMLAAGLFEHNFGDSEFLMLFLGLITLPYAAKLAAPSVRATETSR